MQEMRTITKGRVFFHDGRWLVEISGGLQLRLGYFPHPYLKVGRDENKMAFVEEYKDHLIANFLMFCDEAEEKDLVGFVREK